MPMPLYESVLIARQDATVAQVEELAEEVTGIITGLGGSVPKKEFWGLRNLTFRMKKNRKGHYVLFNIDAPAAAVIEYERLARINENVLRFLTVRVDELDPGQSAVLQQKGERPERPGMGAGAGRSFGGGREGGFGGGPGGGVRGFGGPREGGREGGGREGGFGGPRRDRTE